MRVKQIGKSNWLGENQEYLINEIARIRLWLQQRLEARGETQGVHPEFRNPDLTWNHDTPPALEYLCQTFGLSAFERDLLLLCAGMELDGSWATLCAAVQGDPQRNYPTFSLALDILPAANWGALTPTSPLRRWRLLEVGGGNALTSGPLRIEERVLHYLVGIDHLDERLCSTVQAVAPHLMDPAGLPPSHCQLAQQVAEVLTSEESGGFAIAQLCGNDVASKRSLAAVACGFVGWNLHVMAADAIPITTNEIAELMQLWEREAILSNSVLLLDCDEIDSNDVARESAVARIIENYRQPLIVTSRDRRHPRQRPLVTFEVTPPTPDEQRILWHNALGSMSASLNGHVDRLVSHFSLSVPAIRAACVKVKGKANGGEGERDSVGDRLWSACRIQARSRMEDLAQRIESASTWDDLVLPDIQRDTLGEIVAHVRQRAKVYEKWGFGGVFGRGLGISALFAGASGTGKTMAADIIAQQLELDLYRIDLSSIISKYIGETEKNLRRVFDAAEAGGSILLFDEADALFGKRSEVKDSHDRHANIEVAYLLQRMEAYRGLAILTTNLKSSLDQAFLRRIRFVIQFPFPDASQREEIWRRIFPRETPTEGLNYRKLAKLNVAGGNIRNIALNAAFIAADANEAVMMKHILEAAKSEYMKLERPLTDTEVKGWV
ncbi:ATP-binding protein [Phormidium sp. CCY1219]|nr:ATP-binding protein [Phormidium sp. CCY1219]